jgi:tetratricopeptide (TPR) repeat protein
MRFSTKQTILIAVCLVFLSGEYACASPEGEAFFRTLKESGGDALLVRLVDGTLSEELCQKIESSVKEAEVMEGSGGKLRFYLLDRGRKDPLTLDLEERYFFDSIPLAILIDENGKPLGKTIITDARPDTLLREIKRLRKNKEIRDKAFSEAAKSENGNALKLLDEGLNILPMNELERYYQKEIQQILRGGNPELVKKYQTILTSEKDRSIVEAALERLRRKTIEGNMDLEGVIAFLNEEQSREGLSKEIKQKLEMHKFRYYASSRNYEKALASLDQASALAPESGLVARIKVFRERILKAKSDRETNPAEPVPNPAPK